MNDQMISYGNEWNRGRACDQTGMSKSTGSVEDPRKVRWGTGLRHVARDRKVARVEPSRQVTSSPWTSVFPSME